MLDEPEWPLDDADRRRIVAAVGYFAVPKDMIPDKIPGLGFLDDALMAELVIRDVGRSSSASSGGSRKARVTGPPRG